MKSLRAPRGTRRVIVLFGRAGARDNERTSPSIPRASRRYDREAGSADENRFDAMDRLTKEAGREGVTFYTLDARGLRVANDSMVSARARVWPQFCAMRRGARLSRRRAIWSLASSARCRSPERLLAWGYYPPNNRMGAIGTST